MAAVRTVMLICLPAILTFAGCSAVNKQKLQEEAERMYPIPPEPPKTIQTAPPARPDNTDPAVLEEYEKRKAKYEKEKKFTEDMYSIWVTNWMDARRKREKYVANASRESEVSSSSACLWGIGLVGFAVGAVLVFVFEYHPGPFSASSSALHSPPVTPSSQPVLRFSF